MLQGATCDAIVESGDAVYVRKGPSPREDVVTALYAGSVLTVLDGKNGWLKVSGKAYGEGWIYGAYLSFD